MDRDLMKDNTQHTFETNYRKDHVYRDLLPKEGLNKQDRISIDIRSGKLLQVLMQENPKLKEIVAAAETVDVMMEKLRAWITGRIGKESPAYQVYLGEVFGRSAFKKLSSIDIASIRILDYLDHSGEKYPDLNRRGEVTENHPFKILWLAYHYGRGGAKPNFFIDMIMLFRQLSGKVANNSPSPDTVKSWMNRHPSGLDPEIVKMRRQNKDRIINIFIDQFEKGEKTDNRYYFPEGMKRTEKLKMAKEWWNERLFHLRFAIRDVKTLNRMLDHSLDAETLSILKEGTEKGIPVFVNPYYLSLLLINPPAHLAGADQPVRDYIFYSRELLEEFGDIVAWEKEDEVEPDKPNAAGWILPNNFNLHRRYPEVAILIPDTVGRSCGGLCVSCQRMYDFQRGNLNFNLDKLLPKESWWEKLEGLMEYFENDSQLCDILITGGDALMSANKSLDLILNAVYRMAVRKLEANKNRPDGEKFAEIKRVRLGTRLPVYIPMRVTDELVEILSKFREKAYEAGIRQFFIQTHFETAMEITPEAKEAVGKLISAGWIVTNQQVFTTAASRRGHTAKLRKTLNDIGVLPYYTFSVKGYMENYHNFATNARSAQEQAEEKLYGHIPGDLWDELRKLSDNPADIQEKINQIRESGGIDFLATDRNMLNMPGVGKSLTFRTIGITRYGRRILEFDHDETRNHSPIIEKMGKVIIIESKPMKEYLDHLEEIGENREEYENVFCYSMGFSEPRVPVFKYPAREFEITEELTNFGMDSGGEEA
ncbi:MAG: KamA family protein [Bacteroidales bacterium]|nr:KamA family protein [Bacteroidales bacterium]